MDSGRAGREAATRAGVSAPKAKRKKARPATTSSADQTRPIPQPYLALAPRPLSSQAAQQISNPNLVLPSSFRRPTTSQSTPNAGPSTSTRGERFASSLLAPPTVRAGAGQSNGRTTVTPTGGRRRAERIRQGQLGTGNPSMTSLGHLGRIMESDNVGEERTTTPAPAVPAATRRRRRIVREVEDEGPGISRRLTVSSREEGRAIGLARGASMRRLNVWDDVPPENDEPPPPFPFPTSSSSRLPPTFTSQEQPPIPNSPPPIYELATPLSNPPPISLTEENTDRPPSRTSTRYESAPSSPVPITIGIEEEDGERNDRRMWNEDLLAGYSLEERVQREFARRGSKEVASGGPGETNEGSSSPISENGQSINAPAGPAEVSSTVVEPNTTANELAEPTSTPATTPPDGSATVPPVEEMTSKVESTTQEDVISPKVEPASISPLTASPSVPAVELESSPAPVAAEPASSLSEDKFASQAPSEPQSEVGSITDPESQSKEAPIQHNTTTSPKGPKEPTAEQVPVESTVLPTTRPIVSTFSPPRTEPAEPVTESITKPTTRPGISSTNAHHSLSTLAETPETESTIEQSTTSTSAPTRKLTRGKAIRRSSSGLIKTLSPSASPNEITAAPLFSAARFDFGKSQTVADNESGERQFIHRASAPEFSSLNDGKRENRRSEDRDRDRGFKVLGGRRLGDPPLDPIKPKEVTVNVEAIPPHREAALLRRESILAKYARPPSTAILSKPLPPDPELSPTSPKANAKRASFPSGPLIDFSDYEYDHDHDSHSNTSHHPEIPGLVAANAELLELLEQEASLPQSSSQAASKAQLVEDLRAQLQSIEEVDIENGSRERTPPPLPARQPLTHVQGAIKKKPPPPPPPIRARNWTSGQKISIAETATSPITPRPSIRRPNLNDGGSPTRKQPPPLPTRRPPPPPPQQQSALPPLFRTTSDMNSNTSSMFDGDGDGDRSSQTSTIAPLPAKIRPPVPGPWKGKFDRSPQKPRGPRPAPPPPRRSWARVVSESERPPNERTHSEEVLPLDTHQVLDNGVRSNSEMDLARPVRTRRVPEYTDLDVFVSRLQGSGREYEGFSHIAEFLGPAKSPAAPSEALSTLLPAPIAVESRRITKEGKVKLKLSLLGVRVTKCPICLAQFREGEMGVLLPVCGHLGHEECARRWFREDDRCFVCREKLKVEEGVV